MFKNDAKRKFDEYSSSDSDLDTISNDNMNEVSKDNTLINLPTFDKEIRHLSHKNKKLKYDLGELKNLFTDEVRKLKQENADLKIKIDKLEFKSQTGFGKDDAKLSKLENRLSDNETDMVLLRMNIGKLKDLFENLNEDEPLSEVDRIDLQNDIKFLIDQLETGNFSEIHPNIDKVRELFRCISKTEFKSQDEDIICQLSENPKEAVYELLKLNCHLIKKLLATIDRKMVDDNSSQSKSEQGDSDTETDNEQENETELGSEIHSVTEVDENDQDSIIGSEDDLRISQQTLSEESEAETKQGDKDSDSASSIMEE
jgi:hypothetical protein